MGCGQLLQLALTGFFVGIVARLLLPGGDNLSWIWNPLLGIAGSFLGGFIVAKVKGSPKDAKIQPAGFLMSVVGAIILLVIYRIVL